MTPIVQSIPQQPHDLFGPLPRNKRKPQRAKADRGLPPDEELTRLAESYLQTQSKHWPELEKVGLIPASTQAELTRMVEDFKNRHRTGKVDSQRLQGVIVRGIKLAGNYDRYSCDNSSPTSIIDQMVNALRKAREENHFIPWEYVFCDYSQSGLNSSRQGYSSYKQVLSDSEQFISRTYVDDFTRASRDEVEWWKLASLSKKLRKGLIGASDGFDLNSPDADLRIGMYSLLSRLLIKGLREKVRRGMRGAAGRGTCVGMLPLGFTRCIAKDEHGNMRIGPDELPIYRPCVDPQTKDHRILLFELYTQKRWSIYKIMKYCNSIKLNDSNTWTGRMIANLLWSPTAIGVFIWNKTHREYDLEEEKWVTVKNPRNEWVVFYDRNLAIVPMEWWRAARRRISQSRLANPRTGKKPSRNQASAKTLFSGALICGICGRELLLNRSSGKYKVMACLNGVQGTHDCTLTTSKSTSIIEECLLGFLKNQFITEDAVKELVDKANRYLKKEAKKPREDVTPIKSQIREREMKIKRLFERLENSKSNDLCEAYEKHIAEHQHALNTLKQSLRHIEVKNAVPPPPLDLKTVMACLDELRALLNQDIPAVAEVLRKITGPITITQELIPGKKRGAKWIATFSPKLLGILTEIAKKGDYPDSITLEHLCTRNWINQEPVKVVVDHLYTYERIAPEVMRMIAKGASKNTIASAFAVTWETVQQSIDFAEKGIRPKSKPQGKKGRKRNGLPKYQVISKEVARLRDVEKQSFPKISKKLDITLNMAMRAYDHEHPELVQAAAQQGQMPKRGRYTQLSTETFEQIRLALQSGSNPLQISKDVGCSVNTVRRFHERLLTEKRLRTSTAKHCQEGKCT